MTVIGPSGKDVFSLSYIEEQKNGDRFMGAFLIEAISEDEANGIFIRWAKLKKIKVLSVVVSQSVISAAILDNYSKSISGVNDGT